MIHFSSSTSYLFIAFKHSSKMMTAVARNMSAAQPQMREHLHVPELNTQVGGSSLRMPFASSASSSRNSADELFFDCPSRSPSASGSAWETSVPSYLVFEPVVESVSDNEPVDWRRFEPPAELLQGQEETSDIVRELLVPSVDRIRRWIVEEDESRMAAARRNKPIHRTGRASVKPRREVSTVKLKIDLS